MRPATLFYYSLRTTCQFEFDLPGVSFPHFKSAKELFLFFIFGKQNPKDRPSDYNLPPKYCYNQIMQFFGKIDCFLEEKCFYNHWKNGVVYRNIALPD